MTKTGRRLLESAGPTVLLLLLAAPLRPQTEGTFPRVKVGAGVEYLNRTISWDEETSTSKLKGFLFNLQAEAEIRKGLAVFVRGGYGLSDFKGLIFRHLPFSVEYQAGTTGGLFLGGGVKAGAALSRALEGEFSAVIDTWFGFSETWELEGLLVEGRLEGRPAWSRIAVGPTLWYKGLPYYVFPFVSVQYTVLWGSFKMTEIVAELEGIEKKTVHGSGPVSVTIGALSEISDVLGFRAEVTAVPRTGGVDLGASARLVFSF